MSTEQRSKVLEEKRHVSSKISDLSRYIGFGLVAVAYAILTSDSSVIEELYGDRQFLVLLAAAFGVLAVILDYVQFLAGYLAVQAALKNEADEFRYDDASLPYKLRSGAFWGKQFASLAGALIFGAALGMALACA
jgi:hypothetical protein